jgi:hypothetical protein
MVSQQNSCEKLKPHASSVDWLEFFPRTEFLTLFYFFSVFRPEMWRYEFKTGQGQHLGRFFSFLIHKSCHLLLPKVRSWNCPKVTYSWGSSVIIVTTLRDESPRNRGSIPGRIKIFVPSISHPVGLRRTQARGQWTPEEAVAVKLTPHLHLLPGFSQWAVWWQDDKSLWKTWYKFPGFQDGCYSNYVTFLYCVVLCVFIDVSEGRPASRFRVTVSGECRGIWEEEIYTLYDLPTSQQKCKESLAVYSLSRL